MINRIRPYMMPIAMLIGGLFYNVFSHLSFLTPYLIFTMLLLTYCNLSLKKIRFSQLHFWLICIQLIGSLTVYFILKPINLLIAQGTFICILAPTATSAPVITRILKGNVESLIAYSLLCNLTVAIVAPILFSYIGSYQEMPFSESLMIIGKQVGVILLGPFILAIVLRKIFPSVEQKGALFSTISFFLWCFALMVVTSKIIDFILQQGTGNYKIEILIACCSFIICASQFIVGRKIGRKYNNTIAGGQGLGQKNTILAIWMAQTYLNPVSSIGPGAYVLWQNIINSYQLWRDRNK